MAPPIESRESDDDDEDDDVGALIYRESQLRKAEEAECALGTGQRSNCAAMKDVQIFLSKEECASGMGRRESNAVAKVAQIRH